MDVPVGGRDPITNPCANTVGSDAKAEDLPLDIEHLPVIDDPRIWSKTKKNVILVLISSGSLIAGFASSIQNPAIQDMEDKLSATSAQISLSVSLFTLAQGIVPLVWSAISEIKGRRSVYLVSLSIFFAGSVLVATSKTIELVIGMRVVQAIGSSAVNAIGAGTLADMYEPAERGTKMGLYYISFLIGPSLGAIFGGALTNAFGWRGPFWFLAILSGVTVLGFLLFFKDTFRKERSAAYQAVLRKRLLKPEGDLEKQSQAGAVDLTAVKLTIRDVSPLAPLWLVLRRWNNTIMFFPNALFFSYCFVVAYTTSRTLGSAYQYDALKIGLVLLSFGLGNVAGSVLGGRYSDMQLRKLQDANGGKMYPEMRLHSVFYLMWLFPISVIGFAWVSQQRVHVSAICIMLFFSGFLVIAMYTSTLAYIIDANAGRSSSAVALNSSVRGTSAFIATEIATPVQDTLGDGWMYTIFALILLLGSGAMLLIMKKGEAWRLKAEATEKKM